MSECKFTIDWVGKCGKETVENTEYCEEYLGVECECCGEQATHLCPETLSLVCGVPLCDNCEHEYRENGHTHVSKKSKGGVK